MTRDIYQEVTDRIVAALETGTTPWLRPWRDGKSGSALEPYNAVSGRPYNGINLLILGSMPYSSLDNAQRDANAKLIAAAPELLEALDHMRQAVMRNRADMTPGIADYLDGIAVTAIAKAEGV